MSSKYKPAEFSPQFGIPVFYIWEDRELRFDSPPAHLKLRNGEYLIDELGSVEDTKGNSGQRGQLTLTNLRITWQNHAKSRLNMSLGWNCVTSITIKTATSRLRGGTTQALCVSAKLNDSRLEFIFTSLVKANPRLFITAQSVLRSYETSKLYRDVKLRSAIVDNKQLVTLPSEKIFSRTEGIWNLSGEAGTLGVFYITSLRIVWHALMVDALNVSVPYHTMHDVLVQSNTKFGQALIIEVKSFAGGFLFGFRVDDNAVLKKLYHEIFSIHGAWYEKPDFGIVIDQSILDDDKEGKSGSTSNEEGKSNDNKGASNSKLEEDVEIIEETTNVASNQEDVVAVYYAETEGSSSSSSGHSGYDNSSGSKTAPLNRPLQFSSSLGLAIETPPAGLTMDKLWFVN